MDARLLFVHALSPLHAGTGQGSGVIDLPIAREKATGLPLLPGSSLKGVLRDACPKEWQTKIFGPDTGNAELYASSANVSDARLLLLPVRSVLGTFAWVTSPYILRRLQRDAGDIGVTGVPAVLPVPEAEKACLVAQQTKSVVVDRDVAVYLEDLDLDSKASTDVDAWATWLGACIFPAQAPWQTMLAERLCVVSDDVISFLLDTATEITPRVQLADTTKTVENLWYEEALPAETVLQGILAALPITATTKDVFDEVGKLCAKALQVGGKASVGRGLCHLHVVG